MNHSATPGRLLGPNAPNVGIQLASVSSLELRKCQKKQPRILNFISLGACRVYIQLRHESTLPLAV